MKQNVLPRRHLALQSPYYLWYEKNYDFSKSPLLPFGCRIMAHTPASLQTKLSHNAQLHYYVGSAPFHKAGIMLHNPKTEQTVIRRSFTQLESSDEMIPSSPVSISESISDNITQSALPTVTDVVSSATKRSSKQNNNNSLHEVPYLLRSRSIRRPSQSNNVFLSPASNITYNSLSPTELLVPRALLTSHIQQSSKKSPIPAISPSTFLHNQPIAIPRSFHYGHCPLFLLIFLYFLLLLTNLLTFFATCFHHGILLRLSISWPHSTLIH